MRGRKPTPLEARRLEGPDAHHKPLPEPLLVAGRPKTGELSDPPAHLPEDARDFWSETVVRLVEVGLVDRVDAAGLEMLSMAYARWRQAAIVVDREGLVVLGGKSGEDLKANPAVKMEKDAHMLFLRASEAYGLNPMSRTRLGLQELHRRSLADEMSGVVGEPKLRVVVSDVVDG